MISSKFWSGKKVCITGHSFKGTWLIHWLNVLNANTVGFSKDISEEQETFFASYSTSLARLITETSVMLIICRIVFESEPDIVFHLAAQQLYGSFIEPATTFATNCMGTVNLLGGVRKAPSVRAVLIVTSAKVYQTKRAVWLF